MTVPIHISVNGLAGHATLSVMAPHGDHSHTLLSLMLGPVEIQQLVDRLTDVVGANAPLGSVSVRKRDGLWVFTCPNHDGPPVHGSYYTHRRAVDAARWHVANHSEEVYR